jgi:ribose/xylose/arabinose/galactoside ABC-type transport system permease subunit
MSSETNSLVSKLWKSVEFKLVFAWLMVVALTIWIDPNKTYWTSSAESSEAILRQAVILGFFALGSAIIIISGGIDLSSGSMIALSSTIFGCLMMTLDKEGFDNGQVKTWVTLVSAGGAILSGFMVGTLHAWMITCIGLPPFVATLGTLVGLRSFSRVLLSYLTAKSQIDFTDNDLREVIKNVYYFSAVFAVLALGLWFLMSRTVIGRHLHAMGGNEQAAKLSGIRTDRLKWLAYVIGSVTASLVGIIYFADTGSAAPDSTARGWELNAIAAAVIGGCSLQGGVGTILGTILGCFFIRTVIDAVNKIVAVGGDLFEGMIVGIVVVIAVTFSQRGSKSAGQSLFSNEIGWTAIPILGVVSGLLFTLFFNDLENFSLKYSFLFGILVTIVLIAVALFESFKRKKSISTS